MANSINSDHDLKRRYWHHKDTFIAFDFSLGIIRMKGKNIRILKSNYYSQKILMRGSVVSFLVLIPIQNGNSTILFALETIKVLCTVWDSISQQRKKVCPFSTYIVITVRIYFNFILKRLLFAYNICYTKYVNERTPNGVNFC